MIKQFNRSTGQEWVIHIKRTLDEGIDDEDVGILVCIFSVPKAIVSTKQEAYIPQLVAIVPYHHRRVELFEMERYKLIEAERVQKSIKTLVPLQFLIRILKSKAVKAAVTLPWQLIKMICHLKPTSEITNLASTAETVAEEIESVSGLNDASLLIEELSIPSATKLSGIGVKFIPTKGGLKTIRFDKPRGAFYLPVVNLDDDSEVLLRNLVAYEASLAPECTLFTRYVEFWTKKRM
ncbi:hypothetical protein OIU77_026421 [Salix suchowensis]|uniref:Uncharacterized protein n=1 Tax=Salix suchowensis TaxID=1278906 RepID=A0ABQ9BLJ4_9ROSI|nr:hypothetical protein OIU77_026421 [Salix suchowensis]